MVQQFVLQASLRVAHLQKPIKGNFSELNKDAGDNGENLDTMH